MGIHGLAKLIADHAPAAIKENSIKSYFGKNITRKLVFLDECILFQVVKWLLMLLCVFINFSLL